MDALTTAFNDAATILTGFTDSDNSESPQASGFVSSYTSVLSVRQTTTAGSTGSPLDTLSQAISQLAGVGSFPFPVFS
jgi:hypothetical protein